MKKIKFFKILMSFLIIILVVINASNAMSIDNLKGDLNNTSEIETMGNKVIRIASTIGSILSVIVIVVLGIKYMLGSVEEKAVYKKTLLPFFIGAIFIFAASNIANIIYKVAININK